MGLCAVLIWAGIIAFALWRVAEEGCWPGGHYTYDPYKDCGDIRRGAFVGGCYVTLIFLLPGVALMSPAIWKRLRPRG